MNFDERFYLGNPRLSNSKVTVLLHSLDKVRVRIRVDFPLLRRKWVTTEMVPW